MTLIIGLGRLSDNCPRTVIRYQLLLGRYAEALPGYPFEKIENGYQGNAEERRIRGRLSDN